MQMRCIAIDDEPLALELLKQYISRTPSLTLVQVFTDAIAAVSFLKQTAIDLLFVDVNMPDILGTDLVRSLENKPIIIFTTAYKEFALEGFELDAIDYLVKPILFERFEKAVNKAADYHQYKIGINVTAPAALFVRSEYQLIKIELDDIEYIETVEDYLRIHRSSGKPVMTLMTIKAISEKLPSDRFQRIHRSYIVPLKKIKSILNRKVRLSTVELPISDSYVGVINLWKKQ